MNGYDESLSSSASRIRALLPGNIGDVFARYSGNGPVHPALPGKDATIAAVDGSNAAVLESGSLSLSAVRAPAIILRAGETDRKRTPLLLGRGAWDWVKRWSDPLGGEHMARVLMVEFGGMNETLYNLHAVTGEPEYARVAQRFDHARFFDPRGTTEDPFTGSAYGAAGAYIYRHGLKEKRVLRVEQGHWIRRPGQGILEIIGTRDNIEGVKLGGKAVKVLEGKIEF